MSGDHGKYGWRGMRMCSECQRPIEGNALNDHANKIIADIETLPIHFMVKETVSL